MQSTDRIS